MLLILSYDIHEEVNGRMNTSVKLRRSEPSGGEKNCLLALDSNEISYISS